MFSITLTLPNGESKKICFLGLDAKTEKQVIRIAKVESGAEWIFTNGLYGEGVNYRCPKGTCMIKGTRCEWCVRNSRCCYCGNPWGYCSDRKYCQEEAMASYLLQKK